MMDDFSNHYPPLSSCIDSGKYVRYSKQQSAVGFHTLAEFYDLIDSFPCPAKVMDVGCGTGNITKHLSNFLNLDPIIGIDMASEMLTLADCFNEDDRIHFHQARIDDYSSLPNDVKDGQCSLVTAFACLHWIDDQETTLRNIFKCLTNGGYLIATLFPFVSNIYLRIWNEVYQLPKFKQHLKEQAAVCPVVKPWFTDIPVESYQRLLENAGFKVVKCSMVPTKIFYTEDELKGHLLSLMGKHANQLPSEELKSEFLDLVRETFLETCSRVDKDHYEWHEIDRLRVVAQKPE